MTKTQLLVQILACADSRLALEGAGHKPKPEVVDGKDTGRIEHEARKDGVTLRFEEGDTTVRFE